MTSGGIRSGSVPEVCVSVVRDLTSRVLVLSVSLSGCNCADAGTVMVGM